MPGSPSGARSCRAANTSKLCRWRLGTVLASSILWIVAGLSGQAGADNPSLPTDPVFTGLRTDGKTTSGRIVAISGDTISLENEAGSREALPLRSLVKLCREPRAANRAIEGSHVLLPDGDRLMRVVVGATTETTVEVEWHSALGKLTIPVDCVLGMVLAPPSDPDAFDQLWNRVKSEPRTSEVVWLQNGDRMTGGFLGLTDQAVKLQLGGKLVEIDRIGVVALGFDPAIVNYPRPKGAFLDLTLADGSRLGVTGAKLEKSHLAATTRFGQQIRVPLTELLRIDPRDETVVYLSDRKPDGQSYVAYLGPTRPFHADQTVEGHRFQLAGHSYERGLGTQSRTLLAYRLKPGDRRFQATVGVDERAGPLGSVVFRVLTDGKPVLTTPSLTARDTPRSIDVDISHAKILILATEFGDRGDVRDLADWVEARIIR
ncbi:MAG: NPCBM/NEW2 domain-containing protein [Isosphaeraceae bacterium]